MNIYECYDITFLMFLNMVNKNTFDNFKNYKFIIRDEVFSFDIKRKQFRRVLGYTQERVVDSTNFKDLNDIITVIHIIGRNDIGEEEANE